MENKAEVAPPIQAPSLSQSQKEKLLFNANPLGCDFIKTDKCPDFKQLKYAARSQYLLTDDGVYYFDKLGQRLSKLKLDNKQLEAFNVFVNQFIAEVNRLNHLTQEQLEKITAITGNKHPSKRADLILLSKKIPFIDTLLQTANDDGSSLGRLTELEGNATQSAQTIAASSHLVDLGLSVVDFFLTSVVYASSIFSGEKPPLTTTQKGRWVYGAVSIGLAATAIAVPALLPPLGMALAGWVFVSGVAGLIKSAINRPKIKRKLKKIDIDIANDMADLKRVNDETEKLELELNLELARQSKDQEKIDQLREKLLQINSEFELLYSKKKITLQTLHDKKSILEQQLAGLSKGALFNKGLSVALSGLALVGTVLSFIFPPAGLALIAAAATMGILSVIVKAVINRVKSRANKREKNSKQVADSTQLTDKASGPQERPKMSEENVLHELGITKKEALEEMPKLEGKYIENSKLAKIIKEQNCDALLLFLERHALHISSTMPHAQEPEIEAYFNDYPPLSKNGKQDALNLLKIAIEKISDSTLPKYHIDNILSCNQLKRYMLAQSIDLEDLAPKKTTDTVEREESLSPLNPHREDH